MTGPPPTGTSAAPGASFPAQRAIPFYCPYCGEEDLEPQERDGEWRCRSCIRSFRLRFAGTGVIP
jgi:ribosomal protein L37AE/L43A